MTIARRFSADPDRPPLDTLAVAAEILRRGGLVAFATETVYGLGAVATDPVAVERIFAAKGRPSDNPLIVHVHDRESARACVEGWPAEAERLAQAFWPGPLTIVLPRAASIGDAVTAGLDTVGVRIPRPAVARALIELTGAPIAAPSANRSNRISPTTADHVVADLGDRIDAVVDSGPTEEGLESTVVELREGKPRILRPGPVTEAMLVAALGVPVHLGGHVGGPTRSPGQRAIHYAPRTVARRVSLDALATRRWGDPAALLLVGPRPSTLPIPSGLRVVHLGTPEVAQRRLYATLRELDELGLAEIVVVMPPAEPPWAAVADRLSRATVAD